MSTIRGPPSPTTLLDNDDARCSRRRLWRPLPRRHGGCYGNAHLLFFSRTDGQQRRRHQALALLVAVTLMLAQQTGGELAPTAAGRRG